MSAGASRARDDREAALDRLTRLADQAIAPTAPDVNRSGRFPAEALDALRREGFLGLAVRGPRGVDPTLLYPAVEAVAGRCPSAAEILMVHAVATAEVAALASSDQRERLLDPALAAGALWGAWTGEPGRAATRPGIVAHRATGGWMLEGGDRFTPGPPEASRLLVWADVDGRDTEAPLVLVADGHAHGIEVLDRWRGIGQRGVARAACAFRHVFVPDADVLASGSGLLGRAPAALAPRYCLGLAACWLGAAAGAFAAACRYVNARPGRAPGQRTLAEDRYVRIRAADMDVRLAAGRRLAEAAARRVEAMGDLADDAETARAVARAGVFTAEVALEVTRDVFILCGTSATLAGHPFEMFWRSVRTLTLLDPIDGRRETLGQAVLRATAG